MLSTSVIKVLRLNLSYKSSRKKYKGEKPTDRPCVSPLQRGKCVCFAPSPPKSSPENRITKRFSGFLLSNKNGVCPLSVRYADIYIFSVHFIVSVIVRYRRLKFSATASLAIACERLNE